MSLPSPDPADYTSAYPLAMGGAAGLLGLSFMVSLGSFWMQGDNRDLALGLPVLGLIAVIVTCGLAALIRHARGRSYGVALALMATSRPPFVTLVLLAW